MTTARSYRPPPRRRGLPVALIALLTVGFAYTTVAPVSAQVAPPAPPAPAAPPLTDATGVPLGNPTPAIGAAPSEPHSILAVGDSDLAQGVFELPEVLAQHGFAAQVHDAHGSGWGLLDPLDGVAALDVLGRELAAHPDVDTVVIGFVGVCAVACGPGKLAYGSPQFYDAWDAAARALVTSARARGLQVVWAVAPPPAPAQNADPPMEDWFSLPMRHQVATTLVDHARTYGDMFGIATADWSEALSDTSGQWQSQLSYDGAAHRVRLDDKVHLTEDGALRTSAWTAATLTQLWSRPQVESVI